MATHSSVLAWRIPGTGEPGGLPSMGSHRVGHNWSDLAAAENTSMYLFILFLMDIKVVVWRRQWNPTPVLLFGKSHGWRSLVGCSPWGCEELDTTEQLHFHFSFSCIGGRNGNSLQCSCLENPRDGVAIYGITQSRTRLKWLSMHTHMEFRKIILISLLVREQRRHRHKEQSFGHSAGRRVWDERREYHWNLYITIYKIDGQWEFAVWHREHKAGVLWQPRGMGWGGRWEGFQEGGDICIPRADSYWCMAETTMIL